MNPRKTVRAVSEGRSRRLNWIYSTFPIAVASGPLGTLVQLYLIQLNGDTLGTIYGSLAVGVFNGVSIPAALFWGVATDRLHRRKLLITTSYALMGLVLVTFFFDRTTAGTILRFGAFSFVSVASATPINLLIMESEPKGRWATTFARISMISGVGNIGGWILSFFWSNAFPVDLTFLFLPLGIFALASAVLAVATISEPAFVFERESVALRKPSFFSRLLANPVFFLTVPRASDFRRIFRGLRSSLTSNVPLFYISLVLFYFSSGLFNTSFVPALHFAALSDEEVFAVMLAGMAVQTLSFQGAGRYISTRTLEKTSIQGLLLRGWCYIALAASVVLVTGPSLIIPALVFYPLGAGIAFAVYYTSSNTMMFNTVQGKHAGSSLGVYSAIVGVAATAGSLVSGVLSIYSGFYVTFVAAGVLLFAALVVVSRLHTDLSEQGGVHQ